MNSAAVRDRAEGGVSVEEGRNGYIGHMGRAGRIGRGVAGGALDHGGINQHSCELRTGPCADDIHDRHYCGGRLYISLGPDDRKLPEDDGDNKGPHQAPQRVLSDHESVRRALSKGVCGTCAEAPSKDDC